MGYSSLDRHAPPKRGIPYSLTSVVEPKRHGVLDRPLSRTMTLSLMSWLSWSSHAVCALYAASSIRPSSSLLSAIFSLKNHALPAASELTSAGSADRASVAFVTSPQNGP